MVIPRWLDWNLDPGSTCEDFIYQLQGVGVSSGIWKGTYIGDGLLPDWVEPEDCDPLNEDGSCEVKNLYTWFTDLLGDWAKKFILFYEGGKLRFGIDNGDGSKRIDLSVDVDWQAFCHLWNLGGISFGIGNFDPSPLSDEMFDGRTALSWDGKKIMVRWKEECEADKADIVYTPAEFVRKVADATANRFKGEFRQWEWIFQKPDKWMKVISSWKEFYDLLQKPHTVECQTDCVQKSYDSSHDDLYQTEVKIAFEDGSVLYGAVEGAEENYPFIKSFLGFKGDIDDDDCKFALPVSLATCSLWY